MRQVDNLPAHFNKTTLTIGSVPVRLFRSATTRRWSTDDLAPCPTTVLGCCSTRRAPAPPPPREIVGRRRRGGQTVPCLPFQNGGSGHHFFHRLAPQCRFDKVDPLPRGDRVRLERRHGSSSSDGARKSMSSSLAPFPSSVSRRALRNFGSRLLRQGAGSVNNTGRAAQRKSALRRAVTLMRSRMQLVRMAAEVALYSTPR